MTYATILVHIETERGSVKRTRLAVELAARLQSHLIGVAAIAPIQTPVVHGVTTEPIDINQEEKIMAERLARAKDIFLANAGSAKRVEWRGNFDFPTDALLQDARAADLIIIGQRDASPTLAWPLDVGRTILEAGRPVLLVPPEIDYLNTDRMLIAWKDTREARRAVRDAIPLLQEASEVILLEACEKGSERESLDRLADVETYLHHHGVVPCSKLYTHETTGAAEEIKRVAQGEGAGLIVAGAYGHSRLGELIFGGVTQDLLTKCPVCCLLSH